MKSKWLKLTCLGLVAAMTLPFAAACGDGQQIEEGLNNETRALRVSSGEFDGVFNPFFASSAYDSTVVGQTQISLLGSDEDGLQVTYGPDYPVVALDYSETMYNGTSVVEDGSMATRTVYQIVLKKDIKFSDGVKLTAHDVLFNLYMYLDPNYTGLNTLYSTDIVGLQDYLAQRYNATEEDVSSINQTFNSIARARVNAIQAYCRQQNTVNTLIENYNNLMLQLFNTYDSDNASTGANISESYVPYTTADIQADIEAVREQFETDINSDWNATDMTSYSTENDMDATQTWQGFFYQYGILQRKYQLVAGVPVYDKITDTNSEGEQVEKFVIDWDNPAVELRNGRNSNYTREEAIQIVLDYYTSTDRDVADIFDTMTSGSTMETTFAAEAKETYYGAVQEDRGGLIVPNISGITVKSATEFNKEGTSYSDEYEMLEIAINGIDPKAKWNFAVTVAPMHYYSTPELVEAAMADTDYSDSFGVEYSSNTFMNFVKSRNKVPVGAGVYQASTINDDVLECEVDENGNFVSFNEQSLTTLRNGFESNNIVYFIRNDNFGTTGGNEDEVYPAKIKHLRYQVYSTVNLMTALVSRTVDIADPSANEDNVNEVAAHRDYLTGVTVNTAGYGYVGINAKYFPNPFIRRALMTVMDVSLVQEYYPNDLSQPLYRSFSRTSWVYDSFDNLEAWNPTSYYGYDPTGQLAIQYLQMGGCTRTSNGWIDDEGDLIEFTFTIAGDTTDHPAEQTFLNAIEVLAKIGIEATVVPDSRALYKLASGGLPIWAAAWSSTVDPDMYQVYHMNSRATSVLNWGYDYLVTEGHWTDYTDVSGYDDSLVQTGNQQTIIRDLSELIDEGRETLVNSERVRIYRQAADKVMELAVELPLYQRCDYYVYNNNAIDPSTLYQSPTPYMSPISEIWKVSYWNQD